MKTNSLLVLLGLLALTLWASRLSAQLPVWRSVSSELGLTQGYYVLGGEYGNGIFIFAAVYDDYPPNRAGPLVARSRDARMWEVPRLPAVPAGMNWVNVGFVNGRFLLGFSSTTNQRLDALLFSSPEGAEWVPLQLTNSTGFPVVPPESYAYGNGVYVGLAGFVCIISDDGVSWTARSPQLEELHLKRIVYFKGRFFATTVDMSGMPGRLHCSEDAVNWKPVANLPNRPRLLAASPGTLLTDAAGGFVLSEDGVTFTALAPEGHVPYWPLQYVDGTFLSTTRGSPETGPPLVIASYDGRTWNALSALPAGEQGSHTVLFAQGGGVVLASPKVYVGGSALLPGGVPEPIIVLQPESQSVGLGDAVTFRIGTDGANDRYQWHFNGVAISGATGSHYPIATATTGAAGEYTASVTRGAQVVTSAPARLSVSPVPVASSHLSQVSIRARAGQAAAALAVGLTLGGGAADQRASLLLRGIGPTLTQFGVADVLADPRMTVRAGSTLVATNDNWRNASGVALAASNVGAFALPESSLDAAVIAPNLRAGTYLIEVSGADTTSGHVLAEMYELMPTGAPNAARPRLINVSARALVGAEAGALIAGFSIVGGGKRVLVRAVGPGLAPFGITPALADPILTIQRGPTIVAANNNWEASGTSAAQTRAGAAALPVGSKDAVIVAVLAQGNYTAQVSARAGASGIALIEIFELP